MSAPIKKLGKLPPPAPVKPPRPGAPPWPAPPPVAVAPPPPLPPAPPASPPAPEVDPPLPVAPPPGPAAPPPPGFPPIPAEASGDRTGLLSHPMAPATRKTAIKESEEGQTGDFDMVLRKRPSGIRDRHH